ncbi:carboxypeptidase regulatory-like domain-containing protein, partial [Candidatus Latescibacterota bacterium]
SYSGLNVNIYDQIGVEPRNGWDFETADRDTVSGLDFTFEKVKPVTLRVLSPEGDIVPYEKLNSFLPQDSNGESVIYLSSKRTEYSILAKSEELHLRGELRTIDVHPGMVLDIPTKRYETTSVSGRAIDTNGNPIPLALVEARSKNYRESYSNFMLMSRSLTDGNGEFTVDGLILGDENKVMVKKTGFINTEMILSDLTLGMNNIGEIASESTQYWLEGIVSDKRGNPIAGATVFARNDNSNSSERAVTNSKGQYRLDGLLPVIISMQVSLNTLQGRQGIYNNYHGRDIVTNVKRNIILLGDERYLEGTVTDEQGRPVVGADIYSSDLSNRKMPKTDINGHYRLEGLHGVTEIITVRHPDFGQSLFYFIPSNGTWDFTLIKPKGYYGGKVVYPDGTPVKKTSVRPIFNDYPNGPDFHTNWNFFDSKIFKTDENGQFMIEGIVEGVFEVDLSNEDHHSIYIGNLKASRDDAVIVMERPPERTGNAIDFQMGVPNAGSPAPELNVSGWVNNNPVSLDSLRGNIVVIDFISMDEPLSCNETRAMEALRKEYGISLIGIHEPTDDIEAVKAFVAKYVITYPIAVDSPSKIDGGRGETFDAYGPRRYINDILIDSDGKFRLNSNAHQMEKKLLELIANGVAQ